MTVADVKICAIHWDDEQTEKNASVVRKIQDYLVKAKAMNLMDGEIAEDLRDMFPALGSINVVTVFNANDTSTVWVDIDELPITA